MSADDFRVRGVLFVPEIARLSWLVDLPEGEDLGANIDLAMDAIEATNTGLRDVLPRGYQKLEKSVLLDREIGHFGTGDLEIRIDSLEDLGRAKLLIEKSYDAS